MLRTARSYSSAAIFLHTVADSVGYEFHDGATNLARSAQPNVAPGTLFDLDMLPGRPVIGASRMHRLLDDVMWPGGDLKDLRWLHP